MAVGACSEGGLPSQGVLCYDIRAQPRVCVYVQEGAPPEGGVSCWLPPTLYAVELLLACTRLTLPPPPPAAPTAQVAVKVLKETGAVALGDFRTELNVLQKVHHPHTVRLGATCGRPVVVQRGRGKGRGGGGCLPRSTIPVLRPVLAWLCARALRPTSQVLLGRGHAVSTPQALLSPAPRAGAIPGGRDQDGALHDCD